MKQESSAFLELAAEAMAQPERAANREHLGSMLPNQRSAAVEEFGDFEQLRQAVHAIRTHALDHLDESAFQK